MKQKFFDTTVYDEQRAAEANRKEDSLSAVLTALGGAGTYRVIIPVKQKDGKWTICMVKGASVTLDLSTPAKKSYGRVIFDTEMMERTDSGLVDKTILSSYRRLARVLRNAQMNHETKLKKMEFEQTQGINETEMFRALENIRRKYKLLEGESADTLLPDIVSRLRDVCACIAVVIKVNENGQLYRTADGGIDMTKVKMCYIPLSRTRIKEFAEKCEIPGATIDFAPLLETQIKYKGGSDTRKAMKEISYNTMDKDNRIITPENFEELCGEAIKLSTDIDMMGSKIPILSRGWTLDRAVNMLDTYFSENQLIFQEADTTTDEFKWAAKDITKYNSFDRIQESDFVKEARRLAGQAPAEQAQATPAEATQEGLTPEQAEAKEAMASELDAMNDNLLTI